jgi:hypothetical protein
MKCTRCHDTPVGVRAPRQPSLGRRVPLRPWPSPHAVPEPQRPRHSTAAGKHARGVTRVGMNVSSLQSEADRRRALQLTWATSTCSPAAT